MENNTTIIKLEKLELTLAKEFLTNPENIEKVKKSIDDLKNTIFDFSTKDGIEKAKKLKTGANKFVADLKKFCEPLEEEGKKISDVRSIISTKLSTGKNNVIDEILSPIYEREDKIKSIKNKLFIPSLDAKSNADKIAEVESLTNYKWLGFEEEALPLIEQHKQFILNEKIKFDAEAKLAQEAAEKEKFDRDEKIRIDAENKVREATRREIEEANKKVSEATEKLDALQKKSSLQNSAPIVLKNTDRDHKAKIHNEILEDILNKFSGLAFVDDDFAKDLISKIAKGEIRNLTINY